MPPFGVSFLRTVRLCLRRGKTPTLRFPCALIVLLMRQVPLGLVSGGHFPDPFRPISKPSNSSQTGTAWPSSRSIRAVVLSGTVAQFNDAFGVDLQQFEHAGGSYRGRTGAIHTP